MQQFQLKNILHKSGKEGLCNICGNYAKLSDDHVPPKGCVGINEYNSMNLITYFQCNAKKKRTINFQNGLNFRSICSVCNNELLGHKYDPYLIDFTKKISTIENLINKNITLPEILTVTIKPQRVLRAVIGHLLAVEVREDMSMPINNSPFDSTIRNYFLHPNETIPDNINVYYWLYPSSMQVILTKVGLMNITEKQKEPFIGSFIKFYPIGFWVTYAQPDLNIKLNSLTNIRNLNIDDECDIQISLKNIPNIDWPENCNSNEILLLDNNLTFISVKKNRKKIK